MTIIISAVLIVWVVVAAVKFFVYIEEPPEEFSIWDVIVTWARWFLTCLMWPVWVVGHAVLFTIFLINRIRGKEKD